MAQKGVRVLFNGEPRGLQEEWPRVSSSFERRKLQNRLNQRALRRRKAIERGEKKARLVAARTCSNLRKLAPRSTIECDDLGVELVFSQATPIQQRAADDALQCQLTLHYALNPLISMCPALVDKRRRRVMHYATSVLWPGFGQTVSVPSTSSCVDTFWRMCLTNDLLLNSFLWTAALDLRLCSPEHSDDQVLLNCHTRCLQQLRDRLQRGDTGDDVIHVVASLAICGDFSDLSEPSLLEIDHGYGGSFDSPVKQIGMLHNVSRYRWSDRHYEVLRLLIRNKGGIHKVNFPGIAETVQTIELFQASIHISVPDLGLSETYQFVLDHHAASIRPPRDEVEAFRVAVGDDLDDFCEVLLDMRMFCRLVSHDGMRSQDRLPQSQLLTYRNLIQRRLLLLPRGTGPKDSLYDICRLATLIFSYGVIYPLRGGEQLQFLVQSLIRISRQHECLPEEAEFLLWALMVGALGSVEKSQENFFVNRLALLSQAQDVLRWREAVEVYDKFLWLDDACNVGGEAIWTKVAALRLNSLCLTSLEFRK